MDASNEAPYDVGLDEFIEFTKGRVFFFFFSLIARKLFRTNKGRAGGVRQLEEFWAAFYLEPLRKRTW